MVFTLKENAPTISFMAKKEKAPGRRKKVTTSFRLDDAHAELLNLIADSQRRSKTTVIEIALEELGRKEGLWPLPPETK